LFLPLHRDCKSRQRVHTKYFCERIISFATASVGESDEARELTPLLTIGTNSVRGKRVVGIAIATQVMMP
jgi:hypothetical protein